MRKEGRWDYGFVQTGLVAMSARSMIPFFVTEFDSRGVLDHLSESNRCPDLIPGLARYAVQMKPEHVGGDLLPADAEMGHEPK
jgi:hypothetical protein